MNEVVRLVGVKILSFARSACRHKGSLSGVIVVTASSE